AKVEGFSKELRDPCRDKKLPSGAIKLRVPGNEWISFKDYVLQKKVSWNSDTIGDATLLKSDGFPTYHLAVVVDDNDLKITHVLRGHDWMPSTPIHLLVYKYLGFPVPEIAHLTDILDPEGGKLSKRKGSTSVRGLLAEGYLPEALFNFVILLGWAPKDNRELFTLEDFVKAFDPTGFQKSNPVFNREKLNWFNGEYIRQKTDKELFKLLRPTVPANVSDTNLNYMIPLVKDRIKKLSDFNELAGYVFKTSNEITPMISSDPSYLSHISLATTALKSIDPNDWTLSNINNELNRVVTENNFKKGDFYMNLRTTISGTRYTPPINETLVPIGSAGTI
ncbi:MAG: glutamate--tRNA ligase family protein, partial [Janthinobacterium sp.]